jgi:hypothetical protein
MIGDGADEFDCERGGEAAIAEFIKTRGVTRCPTACVLPTQGSVEAADRARLQEYAATRDRARQARTAARQRPFAPFGTARSRAV